ncbi:MAG: antibiotic biosynthesis monooxygenase [Planctomycetales bacterium]|nr:antibiotic biosynthesis monooxygenase [Planctomycetales bacterium]MBN8627715.1 antibiotic biosynthesis monooxygenase [Planctomycetota bacterium]
MIHVIATIELVAGKRDEFLAAFHELMPAVHAEDGCIEYGPTVDVRTNIPVQIPQRADTVTIVEKWRDLPALEAHLVAPHMGPYRAKVKSIVVSTTLQVLEPA